MNSEHVGYIGVQGGSFDVKDGMVVGGTVTIDMNAIVNTDIEDEGKNGYLVGHLKSEDFFFVESYPTAQFEIVEVKAAEGEMTNHSCGRRTWCYKQHRIPKMISEKGVNFMAPTFGIDRTKWGVGPR